MRAASGWSWHRIVFTLRVLASQTVMAGWLTSKLAISLSLLKPFHTYRAVPCRFADISSHISCRAHAMPLPCCAVALKSRIESSMVGARQGHGMVCVHQTLSHCFTQMGNTQSKFLARRHSKGTEGARHGMCKLAFIVWLLLR